LQLPANDIAFGIIRANKIFSRYRRTIVLKASCIEIGKSMRHAAHFLCRGGVVHIKEYEVIHIIDHQVAVFIGHFTASPAFDEPELYRMGRKHIADYMHTLQAFYLEKQVIVHVHLAGADRFLHWLALYHMKCRVIVNRHISFGNNLRIIFPAEVT